MGDRSRVLCASLIPVAFTLAYWTALHGFFPDFAFLAPVQMASCIVHVCGLALLGLRPRVASLLVVSDYCVSCLLPEGYAAIERYGVFLILGYLACSRPLRRSIPAVAAVLCCEAMGIPLYGTPVPQFLTSAMCFCLPFTAGLCMRAVRRDKRLALDRQRVRVDAGRRRIARDLHDAVTSELSSIVLLCQQEEMLNGVSRNIALAGSQARLALRNARRVILSLRDGTSDHPAPGDLADLVDAGDELLNAAGFRGRTRLSGNLSALDGRTAVIASAVLREVYANILRHCPAYGRYEMDIDAAGTTITITERNPYEPGGSSGLSSGFGLHSIRSSIAEADGMLRVSVENGQWIIAVTIGGRGTAWDAA